MYRLICKETVEEKILQRASQKSTVQQLVMTGGHVQGDLLAPEDVVSLLIDDPQLEQKLKEIPAQVLLTSGLTFLYLKMIYQFTHMLNVHVFVQVLLTRCVFC